MPDGANATLVATAERWIEAFGTALARAERDVLAGLFSNDSHWRDLLALTWRVETVSGAERIAESLLGDGNVAARGFEIAATRTPPRRVVRAGVDAIEAIFRFRTDVGEGDGVVRLVAAPEDSAWQAWTLLTRLDALEGHEEAIGAARPSGTAYSRNFHGQNWLDRRRESASFDGREPAVLVVGAGQAGLSVAARLTVLGIDTLVVDGEACVGDNWRKRYHSLVLHNQVHVNHLPYMPFPPNWPSYLPKDKVANWFEAYAEAMELNVWTGTEFVSGEWDESARNWSATVIRDDGTKRVLRPRHIVMATGVSGVPKYPDISGLADFAGDVVHSGAWSDGSAWTGKRALVIGSGTSGHDVAQDLYECGARVTMVQRSSTMVVNVEPSAQLPYALYDEGPDLTDCDLLAISLPLQPLREAHRLLTAQARALDQGLLDALERVGFRLDFGRDGTGWQFKYLERGGGYYFNVGCSELIASKAIALMPFADIDRFVDTGVMLGDGTQVCFDLVVLATGFEGQAVLVDKLFGADVAERVGPIWGFDEARQELNAMWSRTGQEGLWFLAGSFAQCRIFSKILALQVCACEAGILPSRPA